MLSCSNYTPPVLLCKSVTHCHWLPLPTRWCFWGLWLVHNGLFRIQFYKVDFIYSTEYVFLLGCTAATVYHHLQSHSSSQTHNLKIFMITAINRKPVKKQLCLPCIFTVYSSFVALNVTLGQYLVENGACNELAHQLQNNDNRGWVCEQITTRCKAQVNSTQSDIFQLSPLVKQKVKSFIKGLIFIPIFTSLSLSQTFKAAFHDRLSQNLHRSPEKKPKHI